MNFKPFVAVAAAVAGIAASSAHAVMIDFNAFNEGDIIGNEAGVAFDFGDGITGTLTSSNLGSNATGDIVVFDTRSGSSGVANDADLESPFTHVDDPTVVRDFGNAIILQEQGATAPDDASRGGQMTFTFDSAVEFVAVAILDGADDGANVQLFLDGALAASGLGGGDNEFDDFALATPTLINMFSVRFSGSGAIGELEVRLPSSVPEPSTLVLMLLGILGLTGVRHRSAAKA